MPPKPYRTGRLPAKPYRKGCLTPKPYGKYRKYRTVVFLQMYSITNLTALVFDRLYVTAKAGYY